MADRDLRLNSLDRFRKRSADLVLEEHGSCEVPAGCGGVVFRWVRRDQERRLLRLTLLTNGPRKAWLDGAPLGTGAEWVRVGRHTLAVEVEAPVDGGLLQARVSMAGEAASAGGRWRATTVRPPDTAWQRPGFDDAGWDELIERALPPARDEDEGHTRAWLDRVTPALGLPGAARPAWLRVELTVPPDPSRAAR